MHNLNTAISDLYRSGKYSDLTLKCRGEQWKLHRNIVCSRSKPLAAAIDGGFREASTGVIDFEDDDPETLGRAMYFLYNSAYPDGRCTIIGSFLRRSDGLFSSATTAAAAKYGSKLMVAPQSLKLDSPMTASSPERSLTVFRPRDDLQNLLQLLNEASNQGSCPSLEELTMWHEAPPLAMPVISILSHPSEALITNAKVYEFAEKFDIQDLKEMACEKYHEVAKSGAYNSPEFIQSLKIIYEGTPSTTKKDKLREIAVYVAAIHAKSLFELEGFATFCQENGEIATDIFKASATLPTGQFTVQTIHAANKTLSGKISAAGRMVYMSLLSIPQSSEGLHVQKILTILGIPEIDVLTGVDELRADGHIFSTVDDETWAVLQY